MGNSVNEIQLGVAEEAGVEVGAARFASCWLRGLLGGGGWLRGGGGLDTCGRLLRARRGAEAA